MNEYQKREIYRSNGRYVQCQILNWNEGPPPKYLACHPLEGDHKTDFLAKLGMGTWMEVDPRDVAHELNAPKASINWEKATTAELDKDAHYLVQHNGSEWRDPDLCVLPAVAIKMRLAPSYMRGRPQWIAKINKPEGA